MREFLRVMGADMVSSMFETLGPEERHEFVEILGRSAKEGIRERAETGALLERAESLIGWADVLDKVRGANTPQPKSEGSVRQNVAPVTPDVTPRDVTLKTPENRHDVTVVASGVTHLVTPSSLVVRAKRNEDGLYHCRECDYVTERAGTLRMHRSRKHPKNGM